MKPHFEIRCFSEFVLRTPLFPLSNYLELLENYSLEKAFSLYNTPIIKEAINLASPELVSGLDKWMSGTSTLSNDKKKAFELTFLSTWREFRHDVHHLVYLQDVLLEI